MNTERYPVFPSSGRKVVKGFYRLGNQVIEIRDPTPIAIQKEEDNIILSGFRLSDSKEVAIKFIQRKPERYLVEKTSLNDHSYHPNLVTLLGYHNNIVVLEKGYQFKDSISFYFGNKSFNDGADLLRCLFCQYVVFLSFGHHQKIYQRDVKFKNSIVFPSIYSDQAPHLKLIDFEFSSSQHIASTVLCPFPDNAASKFISSIKGKTYHSHLMDSYYLCLSFGNLNLIREDGFTKITQQDIQEITELGACDKNVTLYEVLKTNFIQDRSIHFYNFAPDASKSYQVVKVRDIIKRIEEIKATGNFDVFVRYLSTPHIFEQSVISFNNILFPYYSISSVYVIPKEPAVYEESQQVEKLRYVIGEVISNLRFLVDHCSNPLDEPHSYSFMSVDYFKRHAKLKEDLGSGQSYSDVKNLIEGKSLKTLLTYFLGTIRRYKELVLVKRGYYKRIEENNKKCFDLSNIQQMNKSFKVIKEAAEIIGKKELVSSFQIEEIDCDYGYKEEILNEEYFEAENRCLQIMEDFLSIGNSLSSRFSKVDLEGVLKNKIDKKSSMITGNNDMDQLKKDIEKVKKDIDELATVKSYLNEKSNKLKEVDLSNLKIQYQHLVEEIKKAKLKINQNIKEEIAILEEIKRLEKKLKDMGQEAKLIKFKSQELDQSKQNNNNNSINLGYQ